MEPTAVQKIILPKPAENPSAPLHAKYAAAENKENETTSSRKISPSYKPPEGSLLAKLSPTVNRTTPQKGSPSPNVVAIDLTDDEAPKSAPLVRSTSPTGPPPSTSPQYPLPQIAKVPRPPLRGSLPDPPVQKPRRSNERDEAQKGEMMMRMLSGNSSGGTPPPLPPMNLGGLVGSQFGAAQPSYGAPPPPMPPVHLQTQFSGPPKPKSPPHPSFGRQSFNRNEKPRGSSGGPPPNVKPQHHNGPYDRQRQESRGSQHHHRRPDPRPTGGPMTWL